MSKTKKAKKDLRVEKVNFISCVLSKSMLAIEIVKTFSDTSTKSEKYNLAKAIVTKLQKASSQKEFSAIVNDSFVKTAKLDAQAKKQQQTKNTYYCASRNYIALAVSRLQFAESSFRQRHEATAVLKKLKAKKQTAKQTKTVKKAKTAKTATATA